MSDILLTENDGGNFEYGERNDIAYDDTLLSVCYVTLFNGDTPLNALRDYEFDEDFISIVNSKINVTNIKKAEVAGTTKLQWLKNDGVVKNIAVEIFNLETERLKIYIRAELPDGSEYYKLLNEV